MIRLPWPLRVIRGWAVAGRRIELSLHRGWNRGQKGGRDERERKKWLLSDLPEQPPVSHAPGATNILSLSIRLSRPKGCAGRRNAHLTIRGPGGDADAPAAFDLRVGVGINAKEASIGGARCTEAIASAWPESPRLRENRSNPPADTGNASFPTVGPTTCPTRLHLGPW